MSGKFLEFLQEAVPRLSPVAVIDNADNPITRDLARALNTLVPARRLKLDVIELRAAEALAGAFEQARRRAEALVALGAPITLEHKEQVTKLAARHRLPAIFLQGNYVEAVGLQSYGADLAAMRRRGAE